jgi:cobalt-precorrin-5B (C1)-methyltransferase
VPTPAGIRVRVAIKASGGQCIAVKEGGDHESDVTSGMEIVAKVVKSTPPGEGMDLIPGPGIGMITRSGLCAPKGKPAISQTARKQIMAALEEGRSILGLPGAKVEISVPQGEALASQTMNPKVGVLGGISLLGSTGFVEPWNEHLEDDLALQLRLTKRLVVTTGRTGLKFSRMLFPQHQVLLMGNKLDNLRFQEDQDSVLCGLPGLILKWALPGILEGTEYRTVAEMIEREPNHKKIEMALVELRRKLPFSRITLIHKDGRTFRDLEAP